ncbi:MAG: hypothetical protein MJ070_01630 [Lachnospiraceae bacterium]|nr:hypothetical protein [Lachnospiraceae bacterium]
MKKKMIAFLLCVLMLPAILPTGILAVDPLPEMENVRLSADRIESVTITGVKEPVLGETTVVYNEDLSIVSVPANACTVSKAVWYNETKGTTDDTVFRPGCAYCLRVTLKPQGGYSFPCAGNITPSYTGTATFDGREAQKAFKFKSVDTNMVVYSPYYFVPEAQLTNVNIAGFPMPVAGMSMDTSGIEVTSLPLNGCTGERFYWYNVDTGEIGGNTFVAGNSYYLVAEINANEGYFFASPNDAPGVFSGTVNVSCFRPVVQNFSDNGRHLTVHSKVYDLQCGHVDVEVRGKKDPTCIEEGYSGDTYCSYCGALLSSGQKLEKTAHIESDWIVHIEPAPGVDGGRHTECTYCHAVLKIERIPALEVECEHKNTLLSGAKAATCTGEGYTGDTVCKDCGKTVTAGEKIPAIGHDYKDGVCTRCGANDPDYKPAETEPTETEPTETEPNGTEPTETKPVSTEPAATEPLVTEPPVTGSADTKVPGAKPSDDKKLKTVLLWTGIPAAALIGGGAAFAVMKRKKK